jgi:hypothetical protein
LSQSGPGIDGDDIDVLISVVACTARAPSVARQRHRR